MPDTRLEGRDKQPEGMADPLPERSGPHHAGGGAAGIGRSKVSRPRPPNWKVIGNQVIFAPMNVGFAAGFGDVAHPGAHITNIDSINAIESIFLDIWDGYPAERAKIINTLRQENIKNTVLLTGDFHCAFSFDVTDAPVLYPNPQAFNLPTPSPAYNPVTGTGSVGVEFAVPSITSANFTRTSAHPLPGPSRRP